MNQRVRTFLLYTILPALAGFGVMWGVLAVLTSHQFFHETLIDSICSVVLFTATARIISNILRYYRPRGKESLLVIWIAAGSILWLAVSMNLVMLFTPDEAYDDIVIRSSILRFAIAFILLICLALISWVRRQGESDLKSAERYAEMRNLAREAELNMLRQQLQPHFLFNSLNSIQSLTLSNPAAAGEMVVQLSDYLRGTIKKDPHAVHTVADELENTRLYLGIEKVRFGDRLHITIDTEGEVSDGRKIPALVLQPLVENAIKHGLYQSTGAVHISLLVRYSPQQTEFILSNPMSRENVPSGKSTGFGISSLKRRLYLLYGFNDLVKTHIENGIFTTALSIPA